MGPPRSGHFDGTVGMTEHLGADSYYFVGLDDGTILNVRKSDNAVLTRGERVGIAANLGHLHQFSSDGARLG